MQWRKAELMEWRLNLCFGLERAGCAVLQEQPKVVCINGCVSATGLANIVFDYC